MKERPILFSGPMVRAILDGRKTQTRRVVKHTLEYDGGSFISTEAGLVDVLDRCPYGQPGDRLWVKEKFFELCDPHTLDPTGTYSYAATNEGEVCQFDDDGFIAFRKDGVMKSPWRSPWYMPRWASRILLEVVAVRVERLQDISEADAIAEGAIWQANEERCWGWQHDDKKKCVHSRAVGSFYDFWDSIHTKRSESREDNPWVWVVEFERITP